MRSVLILREKAVGIYNNYETPLKLFAKFLAGLVFFSIIGGIDYINPSLSFIGNPRFSLPLTLALSFLFALLPATPAFLLVIIDIAARLSASLEICVIVTLFLLCVELFYVRMAPKESFLIVITVLLFYFKLPYIAPLAAGLYFGLTGMIPVALGVFFWNFAPVIKSAAESAPPSNFDLTQLITAFSGAYSAIIAGFAGSLPWAVIAFIFCLTAAAVFIISRLSANRAKELAVALGCVLCVVAFLAAEAATGRDFGLAGMFVSVIVSGLIVLVIVFFDSAMDYNRVERVRLEDADNYYFVKIVPKIEPQAAPRSQGGVVRRIRPDEPGENAAETEYTRRVDLKSPEAEPENAAGKPDMKADAGEAETGITETDTAETDKTETDKQV